MRKIITSLVIASFLFVSLKCNKDNSTGPEEETKSPVPLKVGNYWEYSDKEAPSISYTLEVLSKIKVEEQDGYKLKLTGKSSLLGTFIELEQAFIWKSPLLKMYLKDKNEWTRFRAIKYVSEVNEVTEWGFYITELLHKNTGVENYTGCLKYKFTNTTNMKEFLNYIKPGIGFVKLDVEGILIEYGLSKSLAIVQSSNELELVNFKVR